MSPVQESLEDAREHSKQASLTACQDTRNQCQSPTFNDIAKEILHQLNQQINTPMPACPGLDDHQTIGFEKLTDVRTRFKLWSGNFGVMHNPMDPRALDRRLLDAPEVASHVREILRGLQDLLYQSKPSNFPSHILRWANAEHQQGGKPCDCSATKTPVAHEEYSMDEEDAMMMQLLGLQTLNSCTASWLSASLDDTLRRLFRLSSLIAKPSTRDKFAGAEVDC
jgi:hypothetical protein